MSLGDRLAPFKACDGFGFWVGQSPYVLSAGSYGTGEGAIQVLAIDGQVECKLTVSLAAYGAPALKPGELYIKIGEDGDGAIPKMRQTLLDLGVFEVAAEPVAMGFVERYAVAWRFAKCTNTAHRDHETCYRIECTECREAWAIDYADGKTRLLAADAVKIIRRIGKSEQW